MTTLAGQFNPEVILKQTGQGRLSVATGASVTVYEENGSSLANLYTDENKSATQANPVTIGGDGNLTFFTDPGEKVLSVNGTTLHVTVPIHPQEPGIDEGALDPTFYVEEYRASGWTDRQALQGAIDAAAAIGGGVVIGDPNVEYELERPIFMKTGVRLLYTKLTRAQSVKSTITANAADGATVFTVSNGALFTEGYGVHYQDDNNDTWNYPIDAYITDITGNVITISEPNDVATNTSNNPYLLQAFPLIRNEEDATGFEVAYCTLDQNRLGGTDPASDEAHFLLSAISYIRAFDERTHHNKISNAVADGYSDQANNGHDVSVVIGDIIETNNHFTHNIIDTTGLYGVHLGTAMRGAIVKDNTIRDTADEGIHYSAFVTQTQVCDNHIYNAGTHGIGSLDDRDANNLISGNHIYNPALWGISTVGGTTENGARIVNNYIFSPVSGGISVSFPLIIVTGNEIYLDTSGNPGITVSATGDRALIEGNVIKGGGAGSEGISVTGAEDVRIGVNQIRSVANGITLNAAVRCTIDSPAIDVTNQAVKFVTSASTDVRIMGLQNQSSIAEDVACTRLVINNLGTNGSNDPASAGNWNGVSGTRHNGIMVRWNSGGGEKVSIFYPGVGWTVLN